MTRDKILAMTPGRELDALVAEKVMGYSEVQFGFDEEMGILHRLKFNESLGEELWVSFSPSTDISAAWEVVEKVSEIVKCHFYLATIYPKHGMEYEAVILNMSEKKYHASATIAPEAICKAAILAVMDRREELPAGDEEPPSRDDLVDMKNLYGI